MEQKHILLSALGVGVGLASGKTMSKWAGTNPCASAVTPEKMEKELLRQIVDGRESKITFDEFPYYLSEQTRALLTSVAYVHLKHAEISKYTRNLSPASRAILLSGPAVEELYQQMLAKALSHFFEAKLLLLDVTDFSLKIQSKYGSANKEYDFKRSPSESALEQFSGLFGSLSILPQTEETQGTLRRQGSGVDIASRGMEGSFNRPTLRRNASASANINNLALQSFSNSATLKRTSSWSLDEELLIESVYRVLVYVSKTSPIVVYLRDVDKLIFKSQRTYNLFQKMMKKLSVPVLILGSRIVNDPREVDERLTALFPTTLRSDLQKTKTILSAGSPCWRRI